MKDPVERFTLWAARHAQARGRCTPAMADEMRAMARAQRPWTRILTASILATVILCIDASLTRPRGHDTHALLVVQGVGLLAMIQHWRIAVRHHARIRIMEQRAIETGDLPRRWGHRVFGQ